MGGRSALATTPRPLREPPPPVRHPDQGPDRAKIGAPPEASTVRLSPSRVPATVGAGSSGNVGDVLASPGRPLESATRAYMEPRFGRDLGDVRVHTGGSAAGSAAALGASAYTVGQHVVFGTGQYQPGTGQGRRLIAHELAHTVQGGEGVQRAGAGGFRVGDLDDPAEREADRVADAVTSGRPAVLRRPSAGAAAGGATVRRAPAPGAPAASPAADALVEGASPMLAAAIASATVDGFPTGSASLDDAQRATLRVSASRIVLLLGKYPGSTVTVSGHTDTVGTEASNVTLGQQRADAVQAALVAMGVPAAVISISSAGEAAPQAVKTKDEVASAQNRRAVVRFVPSTLGTSFGTSMQPQPGGAGRGFAPPEQLPGASGGASGKALSGPSGPDLTTKIPPSKVKQIKDLNDALDASGDAVTQDKLVKQLRDAVAQITPFVSTDEAKKALNDAIKAGTKEGIKAAVKALLQAVTGQGGTQMPDNPSHTPQDMPPGAPNEHVLKGPVIPFDNVPAPLPRSSFGYKLGPRASYAPGEKMTFTLLPPDNFLSLSGSKRLVIVADKDRSEPNPDRLAEQQITSKDPQKIVLTAPTAPGRYVLRVNVGLGYDYSSVQEFEVKPAGAPGPTAAPPAAK